MKDIFPDNMKLLAIIGGALFMLILSLVLPSRNELFLRDFKPKKIVDEVYVGNVNYLSNHNFTYHKFGEYCLALNPDFSKYFTIGDTISKDSGSTILTIKKTSSDSIVQLDFKDYDIANFEKCNCEKENWNCDSLK